MLYICKNKNKKSRPSLLVEDNWSHSQVGLELCTFKKKAVIIIAVYSAEAKDGGGA